MTEHRRIVAMLFSDIKGYSKITNDDLNVRVAQFNDEFKRQFLNSNNHIFCKTWGDAFFICSEDPYDLAEISLNLRDKFRNTNWQRTGFPEPLTVRIGIHVEKVRVLTENNTVIDVIGTNVSSTARIEPIVEPNQVFCSDTFYKHLSNDPHGNIKGMPLGKRKLAKNFGDMELFKLMREHESEEVTSSSQHQPDPGSMPPIRIRKDFTDKEISDFIRNSFRAIANYFQEALRQLQQRESSIETEFEETGPSKFSCSIYIQGTRRAQCRIWIGEDFSRNSILYSEGNRTSDSSFNESLSVEHDGQAMFLRPMMTIMYAAKGTSERQTAEQAAEYLWQHFTRSLAY